MAKEFQGIYPALVTPFKGGPLGAEVDEEALRLNIGRLNEFGLAGYLVLGSTGECVSLTDDEAVRLAGIVCGTAAPGKKVIAGTGKESTVLTIDFTRRLAAAGADAALVRPPSYFKGRMNREALKRHYLALADVSPIPIILYNIPQNTGIVIDPGLVVELSAHPNIVGLKESSGSLPYLVEIIRRLPADFSYLVGSPAIILPALIMGASGAILAVANAAPALCVEIERLFREGRIGEAAERQLDLIPLCKLALDTHGISGLKCAMRSAGFEGGLARMPLLPVDEKTAAEIDAAMKSLPVIDKK
jgi:4-hydroxy-2-oxoglutarate aldolase